MTAPALTVPTTGGCQPWCTDHFNDTCTSTDDLFSAVDGRHMLRVRLEHDIQEDGAVPRLALPDVDMLFDEAEVRRIAAKLTALADQIAQARR